MLRRNQGNRIENLVTADRHVVCYVDTIGNGVASSWMAKDVGRLIRGNKAWKLGQNRIFQTLENSPTVRVQSSNIDRQKMYGCETLSERIENRQLLRSKARSSR